MRRIVTVSLALALVFVTAGCLLNRYSSDPNDRIARLQPAGAAAPGPAPVALPTTSAANVPPASNTTPQSSGVTATAGAGTSDPLELRKSLAEKKARLHETQAQFYKLEAQRYALQKALRDLEAQIAADEKGLGAAVKEKRRQGPKRQPPAEKGKGEKPGKAASPKFQERSGASPPRQGRLSRLWQRAVNRVQSALGVGDNAPPPDPNRRTVELLNNSEDLRQIEYEWKRIWFTDQPSHLTPERVDGAMP